MTNDKRKELERIIPKKKEGYEICSKITNTMYKSFENKGYMNGYNQAIDDCLSALEDKVILKSELLSVKEITKILDKYGVNREFYTPLLAQQIHDRQEGKNE